MWPANNPCGRAIGRRRSWKAPVVSFRLIEKRRPRLLAQPFGFIRVFSASPARKAAKQHEDGVSRRRCRAAGTPEPHPRVLEQFQNVKFMDLANVFGWPDCLESGM